MKKTLSVIAVLCILGSLLVWNPALAAGKISISSVTANSSGGLNVRWSDSGSAFTYYVGFVSYVNSNFNSSAQQKYTVQYVQRSYSTSTVLYAPSKENLWIVVTDGSSRYDAYHYNGSGSNFTEFKVSLSATEMKKANSYSNASGAGTFYASTIRKALNGSTQYGVRIDMSYSQLRKERYYTNSIFLKTPGGVTYYIGGDSSFSLPAGRSQSWYPFINLMDTFEEIHDDYGSIPSGRYSVMLYFDGKYVNSATFNIK